MNKIKLNFNNTITERDMDMLFIESVISDPEYCRLVINKTDLSNKPFKVVNAELSKVDSSLGESDITVIIESEGAKYGLLIEDKIDAIAMPKQHERYIKRGELGVKNGEYRDFRVFIFCPLKYYENNEEAKKYENLITYEECREYFEKREAPLSQFRAQQLSQAISKAKRTPSNNVDAVANAFHREYMQYQRTFYPSLDLSTKEDKNGWWNDYRTELGYVYIVHKVQEGFVDLIFPRTADKAEQVKSIAEWLRHHGLPDAATVKAQRSVMIRVRVPKLIIEEGFAAVNKEDLNNCFEVIRELTEYANMIELANSITLR